MGNGFSLDMDQFHAAPRARRGVESVADEQTYYSQAGQVCPYRTSPHETCKENTNIAVLRIIGTDTSCILAALVGKKLAMKLLPSDIRVVTEEVEL